MAIAFWNSWQLWEKMCFVLALGIVIAIGLGCLKLTYNHWRLRKYTQLRANKIAMRREMQHSASVRRGRGKEVPFGVRALEKGVVVEGVWNSKINTPMPSVPGSPTLSATTIKAKNPFESSDRASSVVSDTPTIIQPEVRWPAEHQPRPSNSNPNDASRARRPTYQPRRSSGLRFSNSHTAADPTDVVAKLEARAKTQPTNTLAPSPYASSSGSSVDDHEVTRRSSRTPTPPNGGLLHPSAFKPSPSPSRTSHESNPFLTPTTERNSMDEAFPASHLNGLVPLENSGDHTKYQQQVLNSGGLTHHDDHTQPIRPFDPQRQSQVVRKINSGFEILKPGTLNTSRQSTDLESAQAGRGVGENRAPRKLQKKQKRLSLGTASINGLNA